WRRRLRAWLRALARPRPLVRREAATDPPAALDLTAPWYCPSTMKILYFDDFRLGVLEGNGVVDVSHVTGDVPHTGPHDRISGLIERFGDYRPRLADAARQGRGIPLDRVRIRPPLPRPVNIVAMAVNYMEDGTRSEPAPINAFHKSPSAVIGHGDTMEL